ncbi:MAG: cysteine desulfurase [Ignavibacteriae bacterium]|nr:cysteine desulfurase [Ignavibacteriota bacterium]
MHRIYLDHAATTPLRPEVFEAMRPYFTEKFGNASSIHSYGRESRAALDESRSVIAKALGVSSSEIFFVSSGTEANNFAIKGIAMKMKEEGKNHIITSKAEHHALLEPCTFLRGYGFEVTFVDVDEFGMVHPEQLRNSMRENTGFVSMMYVNNEVGTINPIQSLSTVAHEHGAIFHTDAVQAFGKIDFNLQESGIDLASFSAHKINGPKGIGAMYIKKGTKIENLLHGGGQERGRRAGTENVPLAVGFAKAVELLVREGESVNRRMGDLKIQFRRMLNEKFPFLLFNGHPTDSVSHVLNVSFDSEQIEIDGESLLFNLDLEGIAVTSGSACTSGSMEPSHVLLAMGRDIQTAKATIRFSFGKDTSEADLSFVIEKLESVIKKIGRLKRL